MKLHDIMLMATVVTVATSPDVRATTYSDTDLLLVFRQNGFNDVEVNLVSVSNYLGHASGTQMVVTNWDASQVRANFNNQFGGVSFVMLAATNPTDPSRRVWLSDANLADTPTDLSGSRWSQLRSKIEFVGLEAQTLTDTNPTPYYVVSPNDGSSYSFIASSGGLLDLSTLGGLSAFPVEAVAPVTVRFFEVKVSNSTPKPAAAQVGSFQLTGEGALVFTAGATVVPPPTLASPKILTLNRTGHVTTLTFATVNGANYRLLFTAQLAPTAPLSGWSSAAAAVKGNGATMSIDDTTDDLTRFYVVEASW